MIRCASDFRPLVAPSRIPIWRHTGKLPLTTEGRPRRRRRRRIRRRGPPWTVVAVDRRYECADVACQLFAAYTMD